MTTDAKDILIGPGHLYVAPTAEANPDETDIDYGEAWGGNWTNLGDFPENSAISLGMNETIVSVYTQQSTGRRKQSRTRREVQVTGALIEHTIATFAYLLDATADAAVPAGASQKGYQELPFGVDSEVSEYKFGFEAFRLDDDGNKQPVRWFLHKGSIRLNSNVEYDKGQDARLGFMIDVFEDNSQAAGEELGTLQIVTQPATS